MVMKAVLTHQKSKIKKKIKLYVNDYYSFFSTVAELGIEENMKKWEMSSKNK